MLGQTDLFLDKVFTVLKAEAIDLNDWEIDHLCYRTSSIRNYEEMKDYFSKHGELLIEGQVNGRNIATYKLKNPIVYKQYRIPLIEVPAPKAGRAIDEGWEHIEVVIDISFEEIISKYPKLDFDTKALGKSLNPELVIKFENCSIKFHHQSLEEVIKIEKALP